MPQSITSKRAHNFADLTGETFGRLTVLSLSEILPRTRWLCRCDCGGRAVVLSQRLRGGKTTSCGCAARERL